MAAVGAGAWAASGPLQQLLLVGIPGRATSRNKSIQPLASPLLQISHSVGHVRRVSKVDMAEAGRQSSGC